MTEEAHALLSPSSSFRWGETGGCPASVTRSIGIRSKSSTASRKGTAKHFVSAICLEKNQRPISYLGKLVLFVSEFDTPEKERECFADDVDVETVIVNAEFSVDQEFVDHCDKYVNYVREFVALNGGTLFVEQRLSIEHITREKGAKGTTDALVLHAPVATIIDAKFGVSKVNAFTVIKPPVIDPECGEILEQAIIKPNSQLAMYADSALAEHEFFYDFERVRMVIVQPALNHVSEYTMSVADLRAYIQTLRDAATVALRADAPFNPSADNCYFCPARLTCEAREAYVLEKVIGDFEDLSAAKPKPIDKHNLGDLYALVGLVSDWCDDVKERVRAALDNGTPVIRTDGLRYKMVNGKAGNRKWSDEAAVEAMLREMRLKENQIFNQKLISPTDAEKLAKVRKSRGKPAEADDDKAVIGPVRWNRLQTFITRAPASTEIALETDPRQEVYPAEDDFDVIPEPLTVPLTVMAEPIESDLF